MLRRLPLLLLLATGCATEPHDDGHGEVYDDHLHEEGGEVDLKASGLSTVNDVIRGRGCSTAPLRALDEQIATELACLAPDTMKRIDTIPGLSLGGGARTFLQADTADALRKVAGRVGHISINSGWRSVAQQHVLKSWEGSCGIGVAASPGQSNHQSGIALDIDNWDSAAMRSALRAEGFSWYCDYRNGGRASGCNDAVHFDFFSGDDLRPLAVLAFQKLWNRNNPSDRIGEDGSWGPQTAARVSRSPLAGFARVATCAAAGNVPAPEPMPAPACGYYTDVAGDHIGWPAIEAVTEAGFFSGCSASPARFCPADEMSRAVAAVVVARAMGLEERAAEGVFSDVPRSDWAAPAIEALYRAGVVAGCGEGVFCPGEKVTRVQAVVMLARAFDVAPVAARGVFADLPAEHWAAPLVEAMKARGFTSGCTATEFCPDAVVPRFQMAMLVANVAGLGLPARCE